MLSSISITEESYERLAAKKKGGESFSDVINRITGKRDIDNCAAYVVLTRNFL
ncbi:MAG: antitoxin VapB family protein [Candidatus Aenigmarchaeota archaeon]|nr:antitoxin VapB family protein [Candidatus Aenigmarchaeota archaeon]